MTRDDLIDRIEEAIDNVHDMGVTSRDYAASVADALGPLLDAADALALLADELRAECQKRCLCAPAVVETRAALSTFRAAKEALQ